MGLFHVCPALHHNISFIVDKDAAHHAIIQKSLLTLVKLKVSEDICVIQVILIVVSTFSSLQSPLPTFTTVDNVSWYFVIYNVLKFCYRTAVI